MDINVMDISQMSDAEKAAVLAALQTDDALVRRRDQRVAAARELRRAMGTDLACEEVVLDLFDALQMVPERRLERKGRMVRASGERRRMVARVHEAVRVIGGAIVRTGQVDADALARARSVRVSGMGELDDNPASIDVDSSDHRGDVDDNPASTDVDSPDHRGDDTTEPGGPGGDTAESSWSHEDY